jgi:protein-S-isoprenylcysteine O-methyltransferase Ste14
VQSVFGTALFIALIFWPAGTFHYWQGWLFFAVFATATTGFTIYLAIYDKPLLERRLKAGPQHEQAWSQKIIVSLAFVAFFAIIALPALDHRFGWSPVAPWVSVLGDVIILLSFLFMFWVIKVNSFAASNIRVEEGQQVIDTGPYAYVRHPMYAGAFWLLVGIPSCARVVVVAWPHCALYARASVAASRRGKNPAQRSAGLFGISAKSTLSPHSIRLVAPTALTFSDRTVSFAYRRSEAALQW